MLTYLRLTLVAGSVCVLASCAGNQSAVLSSAARSSPHRLQKVRTTAYARNETGGKHNAVGKRLSNNRVRSAASDWSRFPLGTHFRIVGTKDEYVIDDYGTALVGTNTIDLYKSSRLEMRRWGVRHVDIDILEWGSEKKSLAILTPRAKHRQVRQMILSLQKKNFARPQTAAIAIE